MSLVTSATSAAARFLPGTHSGRLLILIYHRVLAQADPMFPGEVDAERFDWQMALLRKYCSPISLRNGLSELGNGSLPERAVAVTFDDGYADNATVALPILCRHGIPATFFVATGFLNGGRMWNDSIIEGIRRAPDGTLGLSDLGCGEFVLGTEATRGAVASSIISAVKHLPPAERLARVEAICERTGVVLPDDLMMTSVQLRQLAEAGMEIGAHTVSHPILRTLSHSDAREEIVAGRAALEQMLDLPVRAFAYPNGRPGDDYTERDRDIIESLGFDYAVSTIWGAACADSDRFQLPRFTPWDRSQARWLARLLHAFGRAA